MYVLVCLSLALYVPGREKKERDVRACVCLSMYVEEMYPRTSQGVSVFRTSAIESTCLGLLFPSLLFLPPSFFLPKLRSFLVFSFRSQAFSFSTIFQEVESSPSLLLRLPRRRETIAPWHSHRPIRRPNRRRLFTHATRRRLCFFLLRLLFLFPPVTSRSKPLGIRIWRRRRRRKLVLFFLLFVLGARFFPSRGRSGRRPRRRRREE